MPHSEFPESLAPVETEQSAVNDSSQVEKSDTLPQLKRSPKPPQKRRWPLILGITLLILGSGGIAWRWWQSSLAGNAPQGAGVAGQPMAIPVKLATVDTGTIQDSSEFVGTLEAPRSVALKPQIDGRVTQILFAEGDRVQQGQAVIRLQSDDAQAQLLQAKASLEQAQARLAELKAGTRQEEIAQARAQFTQAQARLRNAQSGAQPEEIAQAEAQIESAKSDLELAQSRAKRYEQLRKQGAISQDDLEGYIREQRSAEAALVVAQRRLDQLRQSRRSDISELTAALEQQEQNLRQLENGPRPEEIAQARSQVTQAAAQVKAAQVQLQYTRVEAPFTGTVGDIPVKVGEFVSQGDELTTLNKNNSLELNISIPLNQSKQLRLGLPVQILDTQGQPTATGKVSFISPNANTNSQTVLAKATFGNSSDELLNRQLVQTRVIWQERPGILIPVTAVSRLGGQTFVFVAQAPEKPQPKAPQLVAQQKPVKLGDIEGSNYQVLEGLKAGDKIVVSGILNLTNGAPINPASEETGNKKASPTP
ncbi:efflux RND transporter periplasmic adaptor subunit [Halotia branconii]|uniref:Efflux RND transporter periplasmic adaptor subunit n=1 Tax=Halotia branconii CENA392 TaxID=1539056 RepID=A0AAJ6PBC8_9CYAN|nr:efflux RND transporter periplasmic adaptor subunit [Halotia branconii]WGV27631.1 efflux RND transporter periplasmic adaptor subunit [Halotia branconii CENA392]